ncbi:hypothetical protein [Amycolatopsis kentuckyensis]|uniref:hypothetical protein n=1 Tax=Amycolatopsis kentuckyensis TaxID=218823 RepID=UPI000A39DA95|nr:hypothetical protein [Amycolatopsis kentuckyensis]
MATTPESAPNRARPLWPIGDGGRPLLRIGEDPEAIRVLTAALNDRIVPDTYVSDGAPVVVEEISGAAGPATGDDDVALPITASVLKPPLLAGLLAEHTQIIQSKNKGGDEEVMPGRDVLGAVLARQHWPGLPVLRRIISTPVIRPDGTLLQTPGYDPATGFYLARNDDLAPIPDHPSPEEVTAAREFLLDRFLRDFPWRSDADRANYLALLVTPLIRPYTCALSPFGMIEASMPGSGKTILTGCVGLLVGQKVLTWNDSEDELRKLITTVLAEAAGVVVFDNLTEGSVVKSATLARLMTERTWSDRRLGTNAAATYPNDRLWLATGNNLHTGADMASRTVWVRLDPNCPRPEARTGFTIPNLDSWTLDPVNRATVLRHVLILILDWTTHGAPTATAVPQMRQFTAWARQLGGFLEHHGIGGFLANAAANRDLDDDNAEWRSFLLTWRDLHGDRALTAKELTVSGQESMVGTDVWDGTFPTNGAGRPLTTKSLGRLLAGHVDRWHGDVVLRSVLESHKNVLTYWVEKDGS